MREKMRQCRRTDSSSSSFIAGYQHCRRALQQRDSLEARHGWVVHEEIVDAVPRLEMLHQDAPRNPSSLEHGDTAKDVRVRVQSAYRSSRCSGLD